MSAKRSVAAKEYLMEFSVGLFFFVALLILGTYTIILKRDDLPGSTRQYRQADFNSVGSIQEGDRILLRGMNVGKITNLEIVENGQKIRLSLAFSRELTIYHDYLLEVRSSSVLGGRHLYLELGNPQAGEVPLDQILTGAELGDVLVEVGKIMRNVDLAVADIKTFVSDVRQAQGTLHLLIHDDKLYRDAQEAMTTVKDAGEKVGAAADKVTGMADTATDSLKGIGDHVERTLAEAREVMGEAKGVFDALREAGDGVKAAAEEVRLTGSNLNEVIAEAREGKGTIGKLLTDDTLYNDLKSTSTELADLTRRIAGKDTTMGKIMNDDGALYDTVKGAFEGMKDTMAEAQTLVGKVRDGEGTLGRVVSDETLYNEVRDTVQSLKGAIQDFREQTPIMTFGSFIFGAL